MARIRLRAISQSVRVHGCSNQQKPDNKVGLFLSAVGKSGLDRQKPEDQDGAEQAQDKAGDNGHRHHLNAP